MRKRGRKRLSADEHHRRGTYQPVRHREATSAAQPYVLTATDARWLAGLPAAAMRCGRQMFEQHVIDRNDKNRAAFRQYLTEYAIFEALPRNSDTPIEVLAWHHALVASLLAQVKYRWR